MISQETHNPIEFLHNEIIPHIHSPTEILQNEIMSDIHSPIELLQNKTIPGIQRSIEIKPEQLGGGFMEEHLKKYQKINTEIKFEAEAQPAAENITEYKHSIGPAEFKNEFKYEIKVEPSDDVTVEHKSIKTEPTVVQKEYKQSTSIETSNGRTNYEPGNNGMDAEPGNNGMDAESANNGVDAEPANNGIDAEPANNGIDAEPANNGTDAEPGNNGMDAEPNNERTYAKPADDRSDTASEDVAIRNLVQMVDEVVQDCESLLSSEPPKPKILCPKVTLNKF